MSDYVAAEGPAYLWILAVLGLMLVGAIVMAFAWLALKWSTSRRGERLVERDLVLRMAVAEERAEVLENRLAKINSSLDPDKRYTLTSDAPT
jgi:hypothetical protein